MLFWGNVTTNSCRILRKVLWRRHGNGHDYVIRIPSLCNPRSRSEPGPHSAWRHRWDVPYGPHAGHTLQPCRVNNQPQPCPPADGEASVPGAYRRRGLWDTGGRWQLAEWRSRALSPTRLDSVTLLTAGHCPRSCLFLFLPTPCWRSRPKNTFYLPLCLDWDSGNSWPGRHTLGIHPCTRHAFLQKMRAAAKN